MSAEKNFLGYLLDAWLVIVLSLAFGGALAGVDLALRDRIAANKLEKTLSRIPALVPGATGGQRDDETIPGRTVFRALDANGKLAGWVVPANGPGFADNLSILVGLDPTAGKITGLSVLEQKETPGLGNKIGDPPFCDQFKDKSAAQPLKVIKSGAPKAREIMAVSGATISSQSICDILNREMSEVREKLAAKAQ